MKKLKMTLKSKDTFKTHSKTRKLFSQWRSYDLASSIFSILGIIIATYDYELHFTVTRDHYNCHINNSETQTLRFLITFTTFIAIMCLIGRYCYKVQWKRKVYYKGKDKAYKKTRNKNLFIFLLEVGLLSVFPYPYYNKKVYVPLRWHFDNISTCYNTSEILYTLMYLRVFLIIRAFVNYSSFQNNKARALCRDYKVKANFRFLIKCLVVKYPIITISALATMWVLVFTIIFRVYERPADDLSNFIYKNFMTSLWFMLENMTTLGYGDYYPVTYPGRIVCVLSYVIGAVIFSLMIVSLQKNVDLDIRQVKVFKNVCKIPFAIVVVRKSLQYYLHKKKFGTEDPRTEAKHKSLKRSIKKFKFIRSEYQGKDNRDIVDLKQGIGTISSQIGAINKFLTATIQELQFKNRLKFTVA